MKNKIDHCSVTNQRQNMKICVLKWASDALSRGTGARAAARQGVKNENPGRGGGPGEGGGAEPRGRHKNVTDRPETKTIDAGDHTEWGKRHGDICRGRMTLVFDEKWISNPSMVKFSKPKTSSEALSSSK